MPDWLRALIAGYSAKKLGGGCFSTILVFVIVYFALGQCNRPVVRHGYLRKASQQSGSYLARSNVALSQDTLEFPEILSKR